MLQINRILAEQIMALLLLLYMAYMDFRTREVSLRCVMCVTAIAIVHLLFCPEQWKLSVMGILAGIVFLLIGKVTREQIGYGDGLLICMLGAYLGIWNLAEVLIVSWGLAGLGAIVILAAGKFRRKKTIPMVPFLLCGYVVFLIDEWRI